MTPFESYEAWIKIQENSELSRHHLYQIAFQAGIEYQKGLAPRWHGKPTCAGKWTFGSTVIDVTEAMLSGEYKTDIIPDSRGCFGPIPPRDKPAASPSGVEWTPTRWEATLEPWTLIVTEIKGERTVWCVCSRSYSIIEEGEQPTLSEAQHAAIQAAREILNAKD